jgi:hypothetical protein
MIKCGSRICCINNFKLNWIVGLLDCWIAGLLDCWIVGTIKICMSTPPIPSEKQNPYQH